MAKCAYLKAQQNSLVLLDDEYARSARAVMTKRDTPKDLKPNTKDPRPSKILNPSTQNLVPELTQDYQTVLD